VCHGYYESLAMHLCNSHSVLLFIFIYLFIIIIIIITGSTHHPSSVGCEGLRTALSAVRSDISTGKQDARLLCRFTSIFSATS